MAALWNREGHYIFVLWFLFTIFFVMAALRSRCGHYFCPVVSYFMIALCNRADHIYFHPVVCYGHPAYSRYGHYIFTLWFLLLSSFLA